MIFKIKIFLNIAANVEWNTWRAMTMLNGGDIKLNLSLLMEKENLYLQHQKNRKLTLYVTMKASLWLLR